MSEKFTPGPWAVHRGMEIDVRSANAEDLAEAPIYYCIAESIGGHVRGDNFDDYSEVEANANLIASAPDLYADLKTATAQLRKYEELHRAKGTEDSLAKAEVNAELASRFEVTLAKARGGV